MLEVRRRWAWTALLEGIELRLKSTIWTWRRSEALKAMSSWSFWCNILTDLCWRVTTNQAVLLQGPINGGMLLKVLQGV